MKKIVLLLIVGFTSLIAIEFTMTTSGLIPNVEKTQPPASTPADDGWVGIPLPATPFNVLDYGLKGDGVTDDSAALNALAKNTNVTNWYFPKGYTFRLHQIYVPSHIVAIFGGGTIRSHDNGNSDASVSKFGAFAINDWTAPLNGNFVLDGLHFDIESGFTTAQNYGMVTVFTGGNISNIEFRNCTFDGKNGKLNAYKVYTRDTSVITNLKIYNNESYNNRGFFDIELIHLGTPMYDGLPNLKIYNNYIHNDLGNHGGISIPRFDGGSDSTMEIYNNRVHDSGMAIEVLSRNISVHHNEILNCDGQAFSIGEYTPDFGNVDPNAKTLFYSNHIEMTASGYIYSYGGTNAKIYDNYIRGNVLFRFQLASSQLVLPDFYQNTVVNENDSAGVHIYSDLGGTLTSGGSCHDNEVYSKSGGVAITVTNIDSSVNTGDNNAYIIRSTGTCYNVAGSTQGNTCTQSYSGALPAGRAGVGLLP